MKSDLCRRNDLRLSSGEITRQSDSAHIYAGPRRQPIISPNGRGEFTNYEKGRGRNAREGSDVDACSLWTNGSASFSRDM